MRIPWVFLCVRASVFASFLLRSGENISSTWRRPDDDCHSETVCPNSSARALENRSDASRWLDSSQVEWDARRGCRCQERKNMSLTDTFFVFTWAGFLKFFLPTPALHLYHCPSHQQVGTAATPQSGAGRRSSYKTSVKTVLFSSSVPCIIPIDSSLFLPGVSEMNIS